MSDKVKDQVSTGRKFKNTIIPRDLDLEPLQWLQVGDVTLVAKDVGASLTYVSKVKTGKSYNVKILAALIKKGLENKKELTQQ